MQAPDRAKNGCASAHLRIVVNLYTYRPLKRRETGASSTAGRGREHRSEKHHADDGHRTGSAVPAALAVPVVDGAGVLVIAP